MTARKPVKPDEVEPDVPDAAQVAPLVRVVMRESSWSTKAGDVIEVDAAAAEHLIREGHATAE